MQKTATTVAPLTTNPTSTTAFGSFTSLSNTPSSGISFGSPVVTTTAAFNTSTLPGLTTTASTGFSLPNTTTSGFSLLGTSFGQPVTTSAPTFNLGLFSTTSTTSTLGTATTTTGFSLGGAAPTTTTGTGTGFTIGMTATTSSTGFTLGASATTSSTGFALGTVPAATTGFTLGIPSTSTTTGFSLDKSATQTFSSTATATVPSSASLTVPTTAVTTSSLPVTSSSTAKASTAPVKFSQLEENINKWTIELEEQEKVFMNQVAHINEWDRLLLSNGDKIVALNNSVEKVKLEQQQLDHELDFIVAQQRELEECLLPLEKEFADITVSDPERDATYRLAENLNTQLKHMSEDLKEIIEDINEKNKNQDITDPIVQIGRILNAHMNSLQWVDQNTTLIKQQLDQVTKLTEIHRRENDSTQNL